MWWHPSRWLNALRTRKRGILCALLPALALSATSASACAAMLGRHSHRGAEPHLVAPHDAHHGLAHDQQPDAPSTRTCPHCPLDSGPANAAHSACAATDNPDQGPTAPIKDSSERAPLSLVPSWRLPAARAAPPLLLSFREPTTALCGTVSLNLVHCVLLL